MYHSTYPTGLKNLFKKSFIWETLNLLMSGNSYNNTKKNPQTERNGKKRKETDRNGHKLTETDQGGHKLTETNWNGQKRTETIRNRQKRSETDRNRQKRKGLEREEDLQTLYAAPAAMKFPGGLVMRLGKVWWLIAKKERNKCWKLNRN